MASWRDVALALALIGLVGCGSTKRSDEARDTGDSTTSGGTSSTATSGGGTGQSATQSASQGGTGQGTTQSASQGGTGQSTTQSASQGSTIGSSGPSGADSTSQGGASSSSTGGGTLMGCDMCTHSGCCDDQCVETANDPRNCGACGSECGEAQPYCSAGTCQETPCAEETACADGETCCGMHCCAAGQICCYTEPGAPELPTCTTPAPGGTCPLICWDCL